MKLPDEQEIIQLTDRKLSPNNLSINNKKNNDLNRAREAPAEPQDYTGEDGLLYCGKCLTPKEAYFPTDKIALFGRDRPPAECDCRRAQHMAM